jgi:hypothetical protein
MEGGARRTFGSQVSNPGARGKRRRIMERPSYDFEMEARRQGFLADPAYIYDEEHDLFRFRDGKFAFSRSFSSAPGRIRTCDRRIRSPLLCPLSYGRIRLI